MGSMMLMMALSDKNSQYIKYGVYVCIVAYGLFFLAFYRYTYPKLERLIFLLT